MSIRKKSFKHVVKVTPGDVMRALLVAGILVACSDVTEYSPNQIFDNNSPRDLNLKNIERLQATPDEGPLTIAFIGDSQRFYEEVDLFVEKVNGMEDIDLTIIAGDLSDFGLLAEFEWVAARLNKLHKPYLVVIGNHDILANGEEVYKRMFGPLNYSFTYDSTRFVMHNTNSREYPGRNVPDLVWLSTALQSDPSVKHFIAVSHVPPFDSDFNADLETPYQQLFRDTPGFLVSLHGHIHRHTDGYPYNDGIRYIGSHFFEERQFVRLEISNSEVIKTIIGY